MLNKIVVDSLKPIKTIKEGRNYKASLWNREYTIGENPFFSSIMTGGSEALAAPMRIVARQSGKDVVWSEFSNFKMDSDTDAQAMFCQSAIFDYLYLNTVMQMYYDGCVKCDLKIMPTGYRAGVAKPTSDIVVDKLWLEIPLKKEFAKFYHVFPQYEPVWLDGEPSAENWSHQALMSMGELPKKSLTTRFKQNIYLGNDHTGLSVFFESNEGWQCAEENKSIEVLIEEDCVLLRVHFLDGEHDFWKKKDEWQGNYLHQIVFSFGMQATPVKPFPANPFEEINYSDEGALRDENFNMPDSLLSPFNNEDPELVIDKLKRLGVNTVYVHERWNDIQNSVFLTDNTDARLKRYVEACHQRGMKLIPYFGYEIASLSHLTGVDYRKYTQIGTDENGDDGHWTRKPYQRDYRVCYNSDYKEIWLEGIARLMDKYHFDGIYLDGTYNVMACGNETHGCGWRDKEGKLHRTFPIWAVREMTERLYKIVHERGGKIDIHTANNFTVPLLAFADSMWDGEPIQSCILSGLVKEIPEGHSRCMYSGRNLGLPVCMNPSTNAKKWTANMSVANALPYGFMMKPSNLETLLSVTKVRDAMYSVPIGNSKFKPYYENGVISGNDGVKVTYYDYDEGILAMICNIKRQETGKTEIVFPETFKNAIDAVTNENVELISGNKLFVEFDTIDYKIIKLTR